MRLITNLYILLPISLAFAEQPNLLIVSIDTLRADHLGCYGYTRPTSPNIDRLAKEGARLRTMICENPVTGPSFCSIMTSVPSHRHGCKRNGLPMRWDGQTLAQILKERGYSTAAIISNWTLRKKFTMLDRGFDLYDEAFTRKRWFRIYLNELPADKVNLQAFKWLKLRPGRPFFLWVHYTDPHAPYTHHAEFDRRLLAAGKYPKKDIHHYDSEIAFSDKHLGAFLQRFRKLGLDRNTLTVFVGDHGEAFGEHGYEGHGRRVHEPGILVPCIFRYPGVINPGKLAGLTQTLDILPTILDVLGIKEPDGIEGMSLKEALIGRANIPERQLFSQAYIGFAPSVLPRKSGPRRGLPRQLCLRDTRYKCVFTPRKGKIEFFNLQNDPRELTDLSKTDPMLVGAYVRTLMTYFKEIDATIRKKGTTEIRLTQEEVDRLKSLGYIE